MGRKSNYFTNLFKQVIECLAKIEASNIQNQKKLKEANADISSMSRTIAKQEAGMLYSRYDCQKREKTSIGKKEHPENKSQPQPR